MNEVTPRRLMGLVPVLVTPMSSDSSPDFQGMQNLINFLIDRGSGGFWALGSAGEDTNLSFSDKCQVARQASEANAGRLPLIMGSGQASLGDNLRFIECVSDLQLDGIHVLPQDIKAGDNQIIRLYERIADTSPFPIWIYHNPKRGKPISKSVLTELKSHENIQGVKVGGYNLTEMIAAVSLDSDDFQVVGAGGSQMYSMLALGADAHTTSEGSVVPELFVSLYQSFKRGNFEKALEIQQSISAFSASIPRTDNGEYAAEEKYLLSLRGVCQPYVNTTYFEPTEDQRVKLQQALTFISHWLKTGDAEVVPKV